MALKKCKEYGDKVDGGKKVSLPYSMRKEI
jgi:hypothetical protein